MKLLFKAETFSATFKNFLGFVDADINFRRIKSAVQSATDDIVDIIGESLYETLFIGNEPTNEDEKKELLELVQYAICLKAYIIYAPTADVAVTNNGRVVRRNDLEVSAFKHQIDANNEGLQNLFFRHLDRLLKYLSKNSLQINDKKYSHEELFVPSLAEFEKYFNINNSFWLYLNLLPGLRECESEEIKPRIGKILFDSKKDWVLEDEELTELIQKSCVFYALSWGIKRLNAQLFPQGIFQISDTGTDGSQRKTSVGPVQETYETFVKDYKKYLLKIEQNITKKNAPQSSGEINLTDFGFCANDGFVDL